MLPSPSSVQQVWTRGRQHFLMLVFLAFCFLPVPFFQVINPDTTNMTGNLFCYLSLLCVAYRYLELWGSHGKVWCVLDQEEWVKEGLPASTL